MQYSGTLVSAVQVGIVHAHGGTGLRRVCCFLAMLILGTVVFALLTAHSERLVAPAQVLRAPADVMIGTYGRHNFRRPNAVISEYDAVVAERLRTLVARKATSADPELISLIRDMLDPPSQHMIKMSRQLFETPQSKEVDHLLNEKTGGFFIECGAFDGERSSNTLFFERQRGWTGLLVEMDPYFYTQLIGKSRRAWSINACLSPEQFVTQIPYIESSGGGGELVSKGQGHGAKVTRLVPCFPLDSLLVAFNQSTVDYFSLDVEGFELEVLKTVSFDKLNIRTLSVEYVHGKAGKQAYVDFMSSRGYRVHKDIHYHNIPMTLYVDDFIFVKS